VKKEFSKGAIGLASIFEEHLSKLSPEERKKREAQQTA